MAKEFMKKVKTPTKTKTKKVEKKTYECEGEKMRGLFLLGKRVNSI